MEEWHMKMWNMLYDNSPCQVLSFEYGKKNKQVVVHEVNEEISTDFIRAFTVNKNTDSSNKSVLGKFPAR